MTRKEHTQYDDEFKRQTVALADSSEDRCDDEIEKELGLYNGAIRSWRAEIAEHGEDAFPGHGHVHARDEELRRLRREHEILRQECDILKKANEFFSTPGHDDKGS